jgi:hypothetical protein
MLIPILLSIITMFLFAEAIYLWFRPQYPNPKNLLVQLKYIALAIISILCLLYNLNII